MRIYAYLLVLTETIFFFCKCDELYHIEYEGETIFNDKNINII